MKHVQTNCIAVSNSFKPPTDKPNVDATLTVGMIAQQCTLYHEQQS